MNVTAINNLSLQNFEGKAKRKNNKEISYPQQNSPASKNASKAMRNLLLGSILLGATTPALTSCDDISVWAEADADAKAWVYGIGCNHEHDKDTTVIRDTIRDTIINTEFQPVELTNKTTIDNVIYMDFFETSHKIKNEYAEPAQIQEKLLKTH